MADLSTTTAYNGFRRLSRIQNKHVKLSPWIVDMINIVEAEDCLIHSNHRLDRFCINCVEQFCKDCSSGHDGHEHLQIYKYAYSCVVKRQHFKKHFDCSGIQSYKTNKNKVLYIKQKRAIQQVKEDQINTKKVCCVVCNLTIIDEDYCSVECKVSAVYKNGNTDWVTYDKNAKGTKTVTHDNNEDNFEGDADYVSNTEEANDYTYAKIKRRRKAIPLRAPLF